MKTNWRGVDSNHRRRKPPDLQFEPINFQFFLSPAEISYPLKENSPEFN